MKNKKENNFFDSIDINKLVDIQDVQIDSSLPKRERLEQYVKQIKNPYCYKCGDIIVKVSFSNNGETLEDRIQKIILS